MFFIPARMLCVAALTGIAFNTTQQAMAQVQSAPIGTIEASIGGKAYAGETRKVASEGTSTAGFRTFGPVVNLVLQAHDPQSERMMHNVLALDISVMGSDASASVTAGSVSYWPEGVGKPFYTSDEGGGETQVTFDTLSLDDGNANVSGRFTTTICAKESYFEEINMADCLPVEGTFETALLKEE
ncbi:hypothetical protein HNE_2473 [Hyphomonas neptunium ATCC 15444]|uniref:Lipoprotein n=2 Tax=Hyphomonas TaxID=85 RepID=Q0BZC5_HYPNA|nr:MULTISPECIES: hypothetical protein [Hyphomonas]ABI75572.1 hypothetical protein HNE_2473 [Hyphomonas neptunium ATCC 15444]KCZ95257.1 hypothetical protein HHI_06289 [Hyphomonas hirschiana VP5]